MSLNAFDRTPGGEHRSPPVGSGPPMMQYLERTRRALWLFVELGFLTILSVILIYLILGDSSGVFVKSVADNVMNFAGAVPTPSLVGFAVIVAIIYLVMQRLR